MFSLKCATFAVAAQLIISVSIEAMADTPEIPTTLIEDLHVWIDATSDLPRMHPPANIVFAEPHEVTDPSEMAATIGNVPRGLYSPRSGEITLVLPWSVSNPQDVSVLLHELVHHRQNGKHYYCETAKEETAYSLQSQWLAERGKTLNVNWIAVILASSCAPRDIHP